MELEATTTPLSLFRIGEYLWTEHSEIKTRPSVAP